MAGLAPGASLGGLRIQLGSLVLNTVDANGVYWYCGTIDGWDSPAVDAAVTQRQGAHGAWMAPTYLHERVITLSGTALAPDRATADTARRQIIQAASLTDTLLIVGETVPKQCTVRRSGQPLATWITGDLLTWSILVTAPDPLLYATTTSSGQAALPAVTGGLMLPFTLPMSINATVTQSSFHLDNIGDMASAPVLTVTGPVAEPMITATYEDGTSDTLFYGDTLATGDVLVIDCAAHTVVLNSSASRRRLLSGTWPSIPPGGADISFRAAAPSATALLSGTVPAGAWM